MPRFEVTAECIRIMNCHADSADDAREGMREYLQNSGVDADIFSLSVQCVDDEEAQTGREAE